MLAGYKLHVPAVSRACRAVFLAVSAGGLGLVALDAALAAELAACAAGNADHGAVSMRSRAVLYIIGW